MSVQMNECLLVVVHQAAEKYGKDTPLTLGLVEDILTQSMCLYRQSVEMNEKFLDNLVNNLD